MTPAAGTVSFRKILVPTDFSTHACAALDLAIGMAQRFGAELLVVHVIATTSFPTSNMLTMSHFPNLRDEVKKRSEAEMQNLLKALPAGVKAAGKLLEGPTYEQVLDCAAREGADLIVMGTQGHTGLKHMILGSTAERVVRLAPVPVLTIRGK